MILKLLLSLYFLCKDNKKRIHHLISILWTWSILIFKSTLYAYSDLISHILYVNEKLAILDKLHKEMRLYYTHSVINLLF